MIIFRNIFSLNIDILIIYLKGKKINKNIFIKNKIKFLFI